MQPPLIPRPFGIPHEKITMTDLSLGDRVTGPHGLGFIAAVVPRPFRRPFVTVLYDGDDAPTPERPQHLTLAEPSPQTYDRPAR